MPKRLAPLLAFSLALSAAPALSAELLGAELLTTISGKSFDCVQGEIPLQWQVMPVAADATVVPYRAVVRGKAVEAEYEVTAGGRLSSDGYGAERRVETLPDGGLSVARADGKVMLCQLQ